MSTDLPSGHLALPAGLETLLDLIHSFPSNFLPQATGSSPIYHVFSPLVKLSTAIELSWRDVRPALEACFGPEYDVDSNKIEAGTNGFALVGSVLGRLESLEETEFRELEVWLSRLIRATELQIKVCSRIDNRFVSYLEADAGMSQNSTNGAAYRHTAEELAAIISPSHIPDLFSHHINAVASSSSAVDYWAVVDPSLQDSVTSAQHMGLSLPTLPNQSNPHINGTNSNGEHNPQYFPLYSNDPYPAVKEKPHSEAPHFDNSPHLSRNYSSTSQLHSLNVIDSDSTTATDLEAVKAPKKYKRAVSGPNRPPQASTSSFPVRAFPPSITIDPTFWRLYRTFPISCAFPPKTFIHEVADLEDEEGIERMDLPEGATWVSGCDPLNLYNPRFVRGTKDEKEAMCPICAESVERGGEGEQKWMKLKNSSYVYHMTYYHGVNNKTLSLPFSPPTEFRTVPVEGKTKYLRKDMLEGCCHKCQSWIPMLSIKDASTVIPEIFWWKHAKSCHGDTTLPGGFTHYANDEIYSYVLRKQYVSKSSPKKNKARRKSVEVGLAKLNKEKAAEDARQLARAEGRESGSDPGSRAKRNSKGKSILAGGSDEGTGEVELPRANIGVPNGFGEGEYAYYENGFPYEDLPTVRI